MLLTKMFWPGLITIFSLSVTSIWFHHNSVEFELKKRALASLGQEYDWVDVRLSGRDLSLYGVAPSEDLQQAAVNMLEHVPGVRVVEDNTTLLAVISPFVTSIVFESGKINIDGHLPDQFVRSQLIKILTQHYPAIAIIDETQLARGAPINLIEMIEIALKDISMSKSWRIETNNEQIEISILNEGS